MVVRKVAAYEALSDHVKSLSDKELSTCTRDILDFMLIPALESDTPEVARMAGEVIVQFCMLHAQGKLRRGRKWVGPDALRLVAMVLRLHSRGASFEDAFKTISDKHFLPIDALQSVERQSISDPVSPETVKKTYSRARKHLGEIGFLDGIEALVSLECRRAAGETTSVRFDDKAFLSLPSPLLPPDFPLRGQPDLPPWDNWPVIAWLNQKPAKAVIQKILGSGGTQNC